MSPGSRLLALLTLLYLSQGLPFGFLVKGLPALAREQGMAMEYIGLLALPAAPWALKFLWAPWVDRWGRGRPHHRKRWVLAMQVGAALVLLLLAALQPEKLFTEQWIGFLLLLTLLNTLFATHDVASDGLAVRLLPASLRGLGNSVQSGGYKIGMILGSAVMLVLLDQLGWSVALMLLAALLLLLCWPVLRFREPLETLPATRERAGQWWWHSFTRFWFRPGLALWMLVLALYKVGDSFGSRMIKPFLVDAGWSLSAIGVLDMVSALAGLLGAGVGGLLLMAVSRNRALVVFGMAQMAGLLGWASLSSGAPDWQFWLVSLAEQFADGLSTVVLLTMMMDRCRPWHEGSDYTQQASVLLAASGVFTLASGYSAAWLGYQGHFLLSAGLTLVAIIPALRLTDWSTHARTR